MDTGANISVIPATLKDKKRGESTEYRLFAANGSEIRTYGVQSLVLNIKLKRDFRWTFVIAEVSQPILGADFLNYYRLLVDLSSKRLIDQLTNLNVLAPLVCSKQGTINTIDSSHPYYNILSKFPDILKPLSFKDIPAHNVCHYIETSGPPVHAKARRLPPDRYKLVKDEFSLMQELGICRPSKSAYASPLHIVVKKNGQLRPCGDYRQLNKITIPDRYPIPRLHDFTYILAKKTVFSRIDINRAYHCIPVNEPDIQKTAIITPFGLFEFQRMPFGLRNAAQTFQRFMDQCVLTGLNNELNSDFYFAYLDDVIVASENSELHKKHLEAIFKRFNEFGITINISKSVFGQQKIEFLGHEVSTKGVSPLQEKMTHIINYPKPETVSDLRRFLGMLNFYRMHIPKAAEIYGDLNKYLHNAKRNDKTKINWTEKTINDFEQCKTSLKNAITLSHPLPDTPLALMTDASGTGVGAVLQQNIDQHWEPLGYFSKKLTDAHQKYSTYDRELLAIYMSVQYFRKMFEGRNLIIFTDHKPLTYAFIKKISDKETPRRIRQLSYISEFTTDIRHVAGSSNAVADALSRIETINCPTSINYEKLAIDQSNDQELQSLLQQNINNSQFKKVYLPNCDKPLICHVFHKNSRPYLTESFRRLVFNSLHNISHPGIRTTKDMITDKFYWPFMNKDISLWSKTCIPCQKSKIQRHTRSELGHFSPSRRFEHIHLDIVGPLPTTPEGYRYLLTMIDRATGWPEAIPLQEITAETVAKNVYDNWIVRFGCPCRITTDQGRQFESLLFLHLLKYLGIEKLRTNAYHPQSNGIIERWHRSLKTALRARLNNNLHWHKELSTIMFGLRAVPRTDTGVSTSELTYGTKLRLPSDFYDDSNIYTYNNNNTHTFVNDLRNYIKDLKPRPSIHRDSRTIFVHKDLQKCEHVFVRQDMVRQPLLHPYEGPFKVIRRGNKSFIIDVCGKESSVSIDRLKPAYTLNVDEQTEGQGSGQNNLDNSNILDSSNSNVKKTDQHDEHVEREQLNTRTTRSGRVSKLPVRFLQT